MKKVIFSLLLLSFIAGGTMSCGPRAKKGCKKNVKKIKKMRKEGKISV